MFFYQLFCERNPILKYVIKHNSDTFIPIWQDRTSTSTSCVFYLLKVSTLWPENQSAPTTAAVDIPVLKIHFFVVALNRSVGKMGPMLLLVGARVPSYQKQIRYFIKKYPFKPQVRPQGKKNSGWIFNDIPIRI